MKTIILFFLLISAMTISAEENNPKSGPTNMAPKKGFKISLGYGVVMKNNIRRDDTYEHHRADVLFASIPLMQIAWGPLSFGAQGLKADIYGSKTWGVFTNVERSRDRYHGTGMDDRRDSWFIGAGGRYGKFSAHFSKDIQGRSHGKKLFLHYSEMYMIKEKIFTRSSVGFECYDSKYADYFYGVKSTEATASRPEYHPGRYCLPAVSFAPMYKMDEHISLITALSVKGLSSEIRHSPTTKGGNIETGLIFGGLWQF
jgi:outer membrane protein